MTSYLYFGDHIALYCEESSGYVVSQQTSSFSNDLFLFCEQDRNAPTNISDSQMVKFEVCSQQRYKLNQKFRKMYSEVDVNHLTEDEKTQMEMARLAAEAENMDNEAENMRNRKKEVLYGQIIQLKHVFTNKFVHANTNVTSKIVKNNMLISLFDFNSKNAQFRIQPRYKVKSEGENVQIFDQICLESNHWQNYFWYASPHLQLTNIFDGAELNLGVEPCAFTIMPCHCVCSDDDSVNETIMGGDFVRLFHKEMEAYVVAEGLFNHCKSDNVYLRIRELDQLDFRSLIYSSSAITYWQIERNHSSLNGEALKWSDKVRLRHATTRQYLMLDEKDEMVLTEDVNNVRNQFSLFSLAQCKDVITHEKLVRIAHVASGKWMHALKGQEYFIKDLNDVEDESSETALSWDGGRFRKLTATNNQFYDDVYMIQKVANKDVQNLNFVAGFATLLHDFMVGMSGGKLLQTKETFIICHSLQELADFMWDKMKTKTVKEKQKLLRNFRIIDLLLQVLQSKTQVDHNLSKIFKKIYTVFIAYLTGFSRKNSFYLAKHLHFFVTQIVDEGEVSMKIVELLTLMIRNNRKLLEHFKNEQINIIINRIKEHQNYKYLELLEALVICGDVAISNNQMYIAQKWLLEHKHGIYVTKCGQRINQRKDEIYIGFNAVDEWILLKNFANDRQPNFNKDAFQYFCKQLDLFNSLCYGRNKYCMRLITQDLGFVNWDELFICLQSTYLSQDVRIKYCQLLVNLFIDVGFNVDFHVMDHMALCVIYDNIGTSNVIESMVTKYQKEEKITPNIQKLKNWILEFFRHTPCMIASQIEQTRFIEQVLFLLRKLIEFGFYGDIKEATSIFNPMMVMLDGSLDLPFVLEEGKKHTSKDVKKRIAHYRESERFEQSPATFAIVQAKIAALVVLDILITYQTNECLKEFLHLFKKCAENREMALKFRYSLTFLLEKNFNADSANSKDRQLYKKMQISLRKVFHSNMLLDTNRLSQVLIDLAKYKYDDINQLALNLLRKLSFLKNEVFERASRSMIVLTPESCRIHRDVYKNLFRLKSIKQSKWTIEQIDYIENKLHELISLCTVPNLPNEPLVNNQKILICYDFVQFILYVLKMETSPLDKQLAVNSENLFRTALKLLRVIALKQPSVQRVLFLNLDVLLNMNQNEAELALVLQEVFNQNQENCMSIAPKHIKQIINLVANCQERAHEMLNVLKTLVKVQDVNIIVKRNQTFILKYIMLNFAKVAYIIEKSSSEREELLLESGSLEHLNYFINLVDLLSACSEGDNVYCKSLCQTTLSLLETLAILNNKFIANYLKTTFLKFLTFVYMKTTTVGSDMVYFGHDKDLWIFIRGLREEFITLTETLRRMSKNEIYSILTTPFLKNEKLKNKVEHYKVHGSVHYIFDAVLPFLQHYATGYLAFDKHNHEEEIVIINALIKAMVDFFATLTVVMVDHEQMKMTINCLIEIVSVSSFDITIIEPVIYNIGFGKILNNPVAELREGNKRYYASEVRMNKLLQRFCANCVLINNGKNLVSEQLKTRSSREYTTIGGNEHLPLGYDFQLLVKSFILKTKSSSTKHRYQLSNLLLRQLGVSAKNSETKGFVNSKITLQDQTKLDICCMQILRAMIHNLERILPNDWHRHINKNNVKRILKEIQEIQMVLVDFNVFKNVAPHFSSSELFIFKELTCLLNAVFLNSNPTVQDHFMKYLKSLQFETIFFIFRNRLQLKSSNLEEERRLQNQKLMQKRQVQLQDENLKKLAVLECDVIQRIKKYESLSNDTKQMQHLDEKMIEQVGENGGSSSDWLLKKENESDECTNVEIKDESYVELMLKVTACICKNQCFDLQNYFRDQFDNMKSYNIVSDIVKLAEMLSINVNVKLLETLIEIFNTLNELCLGNNQNAMCACENKIIDCINLLLSSKYVERFSKTSQKRKFALYQSIANLLSGLIEENDEQSLIIAKQVSATLDKEQLYRLIDECYSHNGAKNNGDVELKEDALNVGFAVYLITLHLSDIDPFIKIGTKLTESQVKAVRHYEKKCMSVEIVKNDCLQKVYFFVENKDLIRSDVKEKLKWNIDRSSSSSKIRDLIAWSDSIFEEIHYQRIIIKNPVATFFTKTTLLWNYGVTLLAVLLNLFMLIGFKAPYAYDVMSINSTTPSPEQLDLSNYTWFEDYANLDWGMSVVGIIHNIICFLLLLSFFIANHPSLPDLGGIFLALVELIWPMKSLNDSSMIKVKHDKVKVFLFSGSTLYYLSLLAFSLAGRWYSYYFFTYPLVNIINTNQLLRNAIKAVTKNGLSLIWVSILAIIIMYVYSIIGFAFFRLEFNGNTYFYSSTLYYTFFCIVRFGIVGDIGENVFPNPDSNTFEDFGYTALFNVTFFIIFSIITLNIVFGIIVDTFAELRDLRLAVEEDMKNKCFICSRNAYDFEYHGSGFNNHVTNEHNMWAYIYYFIYLKSKISTNYSSIERYVAKMLKENNWDFFPLNQALCLRIENESKDDEFIDALLKSVQDFVNNEIKTESNKTRMMNSSMNQRWQKKDISFVDEVKAIVE